MANRRRTTAAAERGARALGHEGGAREGPHADPHIETKRGGATGRTALVVLGMHRSGTSALTRALALLGASLPRNLMPANRSNETGHWESLDVFDIHRKLVTSVNSEWDDWMPFPQSWFASPEMEIYADELAAVLDEDFADSSLFVIKDPRICRFVPLWREVLARSDTTFAPILPIRNPLEVAASLRARDGFGTAKGCYLWLRHVLYAEFGTRGIPRAVVRYDELLRDWRGVAATIGERIGLVLPRHAHAAEREIESYLDSAHRHHSFDVRELKARPDLVDWISSAYEALCGLAERGEDPKLHAQLDTVRAAFDTACNALGPLALEAAEEVERKLGARLEAATADARRQEERAKALTVQLEEKEAERAEEVFSLQEKLAAYTGTIKALRSEMEDLARARAHAVSQATDLEAQLAETSSKLERLESAFNEERRQREALSAERDLFAARATDLDTQLAEANNMLAHLEGSLVEERRQQEGLAARAEEAERRSSAFRTALASAIRDEQVELERAWRQRIDEMVTLRASLAERTRQLHEAVATRGPIVATAKLAAARLRARLSPKAYIDGRAAYTRRMYSRIERSGLFDRDYYLAMSPDLIASGTDSLDHYLRSGESKGCKPHPLFDPTFYFKTNPDVEASGMNALYHFIRCGASEGRWPNPWFDPTWYVEQYPDVSASGINPLRHYARFGNEEKRQPSQRFDTGWYRARYLSDQPDIDPLWYHVEYGAAAGLNVNPDEEARKLAVPLKARRSLAILDEASSVLVPAGPESIPTYADVRGRQRRFSARVKTALAEFGGREFIERVGKDECPRLARIDGLRPRHAGAPTVVVCAHVAGERRYGAERSLIDILQGLSPLPVNVIVTIPQNNPEYTAELRQHATEVIYFPYNWWRNAAAPSAREVAAFVELFRSVEASAVHINTIVLRAPMAAACLENVPVVCHVREIIQHDDGLLQMIGLPAERIRTLVADAADWIVANSKATADAFQEPDRTVVVPNTVDVDQLDIPNDVDPDAIRFGLISSNLPKKGIEDFVALARLVSNSVPNARFLLIGQKTEFTARLEQEQVRDSTPRNLELVDYQESPVRAIGMVNVVVNFSRFAESFGRTVLEGMAARRPAIVYDWGSLPELVRHGVNGYVVPYRQYQEAAQYVAELCRNPEMIKTLGEEGRAIAEKSFGKSIFSERLCDFYRRLLDRSTESEPARSAEGALVEELDAPVHSVRPRVFPTRAVTQTAEVESPKIAYFMWHFPVPSETFVLNELRHLVGQGQDVLVFCRQSPHRDFAPDFPIEWERVSTPSQLASRLRESGRTIVHAHFTYPTVTDFVWPACVEAEIPFTFIAHAQDIFRYANDEKNRIGEVVSHPLCRRVFVLSRFHRDYLIERGVPRGKIVINPNAIDPQAFTAGQIEDRPKRRFRRVAAVQRFIEKKGLEHLIRAARFLEDDGIGVDIYGYGELEEHYRQIIAAEGIRNVEIHGRVAGADALNEVLRTHDLFVCPSVRAADGDMDGIPTALLEASAAGLPVLATPISGIPDLISHEVNGLLCEPTPEAIAAAIKSFYGLPETQVESMIEAGLAVVKNRFTVDRLARVLVRVWQNKTIDIVIVSWNNLPELKAIIERLYAFTSLPFHLIVCDNDSGPNVKDHLDRLWAEKDNLTLIHNGTNALVGPGTNRAVEHGWSDIAIYVCGKEGFVFQSGWEIPFVHVMAEEPDVGLCGKLGHSPSYLYGRQYPEGISEFARFRNPQFALDDPDRIFRHVQGGIFGMRRRMLERIGGFSEAVPHSYTDVEFSHYVESSGWRLGEVPHLVSLFNKTRPPLSAHMDETIYAAHPPKLQDMEWIGQIVDKGHVHCNLCGTTADAFDGHPSYPTCGSCGSTPADRSLYRWLTNSILLFRRLPAFAVGLQGMMERIWTEQFQGRAYTENALKKQLGRSGGLDNRDAGLDVALVRGRPAEHDAALIKEAGRVLKPGGTLLLQAGDDWQRCPANPVPPTVAAELFRAADTARYHSAALRFDWRRLLVLERLP